MKAPKMFRPFGLVIVLCNSHRTNDREAPAKCYKCQARVFQPEGTLPQIARELLASNLPAPYCIACVAHLSPETPLLFRCKRHKTWHRVTAREAQQTITGMTMGN
jgi:hypothetical protein